MSSPRLEGTKMALAVSSRVSRASACWDGVSFARGMRVAWGMESDMVHCVLEEDKG
jgi:hypothetical protein